MIKSLLLFTFSLITCCFVNVALAKNVVGDFSSTTLQDWENKSFVGMTRYQRVWFKDSMVLKAESHQQASGLVKKQRIDLTKTPFLNWRWRIENRLKKHNEQTKSGDDYAARIYIIIDGGWTFWKTLALNYVWANTTDKGQSWENAYAGKNAMMLALRSSTDQTKTWYQEKRNVLADIRKYFGKDIRHIDAIAIMTDTDDGRGQVTAYYGDIFFTSN